VTRSVELVNHISARTRGLLAARPEPAKLGPPSLIRGEEWLPAIAVTALFVLMLVVTWHRWTHPIIDHGREMNVPARILSGERLYIDIMYYYGPFAPYFNALLYRMFGTHLNTLYASGIVCAALVLVMIHWIGRRLLSPWAAALSTSLVLVTCAIGMKLGYVQPYSYAALYGWTFGVGALVCALQYLRADAEMAMLAGGLLAAGATVSKPELILLGLGPAGVAWAIRSFGAGRWPLRPLLLLIVPPLAIGGLVYGVIVWLVPWKLLVTDTYRAFTQPQMIYFAHLLNGTSDWPQTGWALAAGIGVLACIAGGAALFGLGSDPVVSMFRGSRARAIWLVTILGAAAWWYGGSSRSVWIDISPLRSAPLVLASIVVTTAWDAYREKSRGAVLSIEEQSLLVVTVFSGLAIARVILNVSFANPYTPFTIPTVLIVYVWLLVDRLPRFLLATHASRTGARHCAMAVGVFVLVPLIGAQFVIARTAKVFEISAPRGTLLTDRTLGRPIADAIQFAREHTAPGEYLGSLPQGSIVNFLAERANPLREEIIVPGYLTPDREADAIHRMSARRVRVILVGNVLTPEYRDNAFGVDYNRRLMQWVETNYHPIATFSDQGGAELRFGEPAFFIRAYERNE
jgi:hypothetical protein